MNLINNYLQLTFDVGNTGVNFGSGATDGGCTATRIGDGILNGFGDSADALLQVLASFVDTFARGSLGFTQLGSTASGGSSITGGDG